MNAVQFINNSVTARQIFCPHCLPSR